MIARESRTNYPKAFDSYSKESQEGNLELFAKRLEDSVRYLLFRKKAGSEEKKSSHSPKQKLNATRYGKNQDQYWCVSYQPDLPAKWDSRESQSNKKDNLLNNF